MEGPPSLSSVSDDGSYDISSGPLTPTSSLLFRPIHTGVAVEKHLTEYLAGVLPSKQESVSSSNQSRDTPFNIRNICFIGAGYVGGPTAAVLALHTPKLTVKVLDRDTRRINAWQSAHLPIHEPGLDNVVRLARDGGVKSSSSEPEPARERSPNLFFTTNAQQCLSEADMIFLAVNTPTKTFGQGAGRATNMNAVDGAVRDIATYAKDGVIIVEKSTVPCGTAQRIDIKVLFLPSLSRTTAAATKSALTYQPSSAPSAQNSALKSSPTPNSSPKAAQSMTSSAPTASSSAPLKHFQEMQRLPP
jgi:UDPglucose 6-dehydrogenase